tara:strand:- start:20122 stop:20466 length:345 start_codon:yes stop_codon:yes gene_type:complete
MEEVNREPFVLVSVFNDGANPEQVATIMPTLSMMIDEWQNSGKMIWSGPFDDNKTSMSVIEATESEAEQFYTKYNNTTQQFLSTYMYKWEAMPFLSLIGKKINQASLEITPEQQ